MAIYSYEYDLSYSPAAPQVSIHVQAFGQIDGGTVVVAMVDSGADATMIPQDVLESINAVQTGSAQMRGVTDIQTVVDLYRVSIAIGPFTHPSVSVISVRSGTEALIGRDVLNHLSVRLDGPAQVVEVSE